MSGYYSEKLSGKRLRQCYEIAPPRILQYLETEANYVLRKIHSGDAVLELGCGYGRILLLLARKAGQVYGVDTSEESLGLAQEMLKGISNCHLYCMNAVKLAFPDHMFDVVVCIQNGISAFHVNQEDLIRETIRVTRPKGTILFSSYSQKIWKDRLEWFELQSKAGLVGKIDLEKTRDRVIVCKDGFAATTVGPEQFLALTSRFNVNAKIVEVDESSLFCEIVSG